MTMKINGLISLRKLTITSIVLLAAGCAGQTNGPGRVVFNLDGIPTVLNDMGEPVEPMENVVEGGTPMAKYEIEFKKVNPCYINICGRGKCRSYKISDGPCPTK